MHILLLADFIANDDPFVDDGKDIFIDQRYLLDKDNKLNDDTLLVNTVNQFFSEQTDHVSLNIKSPYDTGKTQLLKEIMAIYKPRRVLWLSTRITYTCDILKNIENSSILLISIRKNLNLTGS